MVEVTLARIVGFRFSGDEKETLLRALKELCPNQLLIDPEEAIRELEIIVGAHAFGISAGTHIGPKEIREAGKHYEKIEKAARKLHSLLQETSAITLGQNLYKLEELPPPICELYHEDEHAIVKSDTVIDIWMRAKLKANELRELARKKAGRHHPEFDEFCEEVLNWLGRTGGFEPVKSERQSLMELFQTCWNAIGRTEAKKGFEKVCVPEKTDRQIREAITRILNK